MLEKYLKKMQEQHSLNPIEEEEFLAWKESKVTKRFFADFRENVLIQIEDVGKHDSAEQIHHFAVQFNSNYETYMTLFRWVPSEIFFDGEGWDKELEANRENVV